MKQEKFLITTKMEKEDYRKFLYIATFLRKKSVMPSIILLCLIGALFVNFSSNGISLSGFGFTFVFMFVLVMGISCFRIERKNKQRIKTDKTGTFGAESILRFYEEHLEMETPALHSHAELRYDQFYGVMESKDYFIFYITVNQASLVRKKDMKDEVVMEFRTFLKGVFGEKYRKL